MNIRTSGPLWSATAAVFVMTGCGFIPLKKGKSNKSKAKQEKFVGEFEFVNQSGADVCGIEIQTSKDKKDGFVLHGERVANGGSIKLTTKMPADQVAVAACDGDGLVSYGGVALTAPKLTLFADGKSAKAADHPAISANWKKTWPEQLSYMGKYIRIKGGIQHKEGALAKKALAAVQAKAASDTRWKDTPVVALIAGKHGDKGFPAYVGHLFEDGHCSVQAHWFTMNEDEVKYSRPYPMVGGMDTCAFMAWITAQDGSAK